jgi:hypothetical protein
MVVHFGYIHLPVDLQPGVVVINLQRQITSLVAFPKLVQKTKSMATLNVVNIHFNDTTYRLLYTINTM